MKEENQMKNSSMRIYYNNSNYCANIDVDPILLGKLLTQLCKNVNIPSEEDHSSKNLKIDAAIVIVKKKNYRM